MKREITKRLLSSIIIIPVSLYFIIKGSLFFTFFLSILFLVTSYEWIKMNKENNLAKFIGIIFLIFSIYTAYIFREKLELTAFIFVILICIFSDLGGYFFGKIFQGPKLIKISPNKTYTGVIGSFIFSIAAALIYDHYFGPVGIGYLFYMQEFGIEFRFSFLLLILSISLVSQIGDLIISYFKRKAKIKDTGKILPGHGGLLDRIDGIIFALPFSYFFLNIVFFK